MKRKHQSCSGNERRSNLGVRGVDGEEVGIGTPLVMYWGRCRKLIFGRPLLGIVRWMRVLQGRYATHWLLQQLNMTIFVLTPLFIFIYHVCLRMIARRVRVHDRPLCMRRVFDFLDWSVGGFCCSQSLSHILKHQLDTTAQQLKGQNKYDVDVSLTEHCRVTDMCRGVSDHLAERSRKSKHRFDKLQRACHYLFASEWKIA